MFHRNASNHLQDYVAALLRRRQSLVQEHEVSESYCQSDLRSSDSFQISMNHDRKLKGTKMGWTSNEMDVPESFIWEEFELYKICVIVQRVLKKCSCIH